MRRKQLRAGKSAKPGLPEPALDFVTSIDRLVRFSKESDVVSLSRFVELVDAFAKERRGFSESLLGCEKTIGDAYRRLSSEQRVQCFRILYDRFSENYDKHMEKTGHFAAIAKVMAHAAPFIRFPIMDLTAGTGEPMAYAICQSPDHAKRFSMRRSMAYLNEISPRMLDKAKDKLQGAGSIRFTAYDAFSLPSHLRGRFRSVLCSQTLHLISDKDKPRLVRSMFNALGMGGTAIVIEEDPFTVSPTPEIDGISVFIGSIASPISNPERIRGLFTPFGFQKIEAGASWPIDQHHAMRLHVFKKG